MSIHNGLDIVAIVTHGVFSKTYGAAENSNVANLFASMGLLEDAPINSGFLSKTRIKKWLTYFWIRRR